MNSSQYVINTYVNYKNCKDCKEENKKTHCICNIIKYYACFKINDKKCYLCDKGFSSKNKENCNNCHYDYCDNCHEICIKLNQSQR